MAKMVNICDVCSEIFAGGDAPKNNMSIVQTDEYSVPIYSNGEANDGLYGFTNFAKVSEPSITISARGTIGYTSIRNTPFVPIVRLITLVPKKDVIDIRYLFYAAQNYHFDGCGTSIPQLTVPALKKYNFPLPTIAEQKQIVIVLDKICDLITLRKKQLLKLDELVKSRFVELFGNLVIGDKVDLNKKKIGDIASVTKLAGFEFTKYIQYKEQGDIIMLRGLNCKKGHLVLDDIKWIDKETSDLLPRSKLYYGDILMTYAGTIGDVAMVDADDKYHLAPNVAKITLNDKTACNPVFLMHLFMYTNDYIMTFASVVAQASINMEKIRNFEYYFPPIELQNQFAAFVEQNDKSKLAIQQSLEKLEMLKKALMQKYFG